MSLLQPDNRHSCEGGDPVWWLAWIPAFAGMAVLLVATLSSVHALGEPIKYARYQIDGEIRHGIVEAARVYDISGDLFGAAKRTGTSYALSEIRLLAPIVPRNVLAVGLNYRSHAGFTGSHPEIFLKTLSSISGPGDPIPHFPDSSSLHYEGEMVVVIGKTALDVPPDKVADYILGVTAGNDVSERAWQGGDLQWWRAKGADGFAPIGPYLVSGLSYDDLLLQTRLNGKVVQSERTSGMTHDVAAIVSWISHYVTLNPGDVIFTGTPGSTSSMKPGDVVEIELQGVGVLRNPVRARRR